MKKEKKAITLRSVKLLWNHAGQRPIEVSLITQELIDDVTAQPRREASDTILLPSAPRPNRQTADLRHRAARAAACIVLLAGAGTFWLARIDSVEEPKPSPSLSELNMRDEESAALPPAVDTISAEDLTGNVQRSHHRYAMVREGHQWQTSAAPASCQEEEHGNAGMVCYSGGQFSDNCDEETVTRMLMSFL